MDSEKNLKAFGKLISEISSGRIMSREESREAYKQVILNEQPELQQGAFLITHISRGPTAEELSGAWDALNQYDTEKFKANIKGPICDIVGTGSDNLKTVNCSTPAAFIAAACGLPIAKKGARKVTGVLGASDILEELCIDINSPVSKAKECLEKYGICYLAGESFLKSGWARLIKSMRFTSAFNILGPITCPCENLDYIVVGGYSEKVCEQLISILNEIGIKGALSPYGMAYGAGNFYGMDEFSNIGVTKVIELKNSTINKYELIPEDFGIKTSIYERITSFEDVKYNTKAIMEVLKGKYDTPLADFFCINAAACLYISDFASSYKQGYDMAKEALATGKALEKLQHLKAIQGSSNILIPECN